MKYQRTFYLFLFFAFALQLSSQNEDLDIDMYIDSLTELSNDRKHNKILDIIDSVGVYTPFIRLMQAEAYYFTGEDVLAYEVLDTMFSADIDVEHRSRFAFNKGAICDYNAQYDKALLNKDTAEMFIKQNVDAHTLCDVISSKGNSEFYKGNMLKAIAHFQRSIACFEDEGYLDRAATSKVNVGALLIETRNFNKAIQEFKEILAYWKESDPENPYHSNVYINMGIAYQNLSPDSALVYLEKAKPYLKGPDLWNFHNSMANNYIKMESLDSAKVHIDKAIKIANTYEKNEEFNYSKSTECLYLYESGKVNQAVKCFDGVKAYFTTSQSPVTYRDFLKYYTKAKYKKAYGTNDLDEYHVVADSIENNNVKLAIDNSIFELKSRAVQDSLAFSKAEAGLLQTSNRQQKLSFSIILGLLGLLLGGGLYLYNKLRKRKNQITLLNQELNHRVKNNLAFMTSLMQMQARRTESEETKAVLKESENRLLALSKVHASLKSGETMDINISRYISEIINNLKDAFHSPDKQLLISHQIPETMLDAETSMRLGLIINELITNSLKHVDAKEIKVDLSIVQSSTGGLTLKYADNGMGIEKFLQNSDTSSSMGLQMIQILRNQLKGKVDILLV